MRCGSTIALNVQTLLESGCLSRDRFSVDSSEILGEPSQQQHHHHDDGSGNVGNVGSNNGDDGIDESIYESQNTTTPLRILNAVKLSLALTRAFAQCWNNNTQNYTDLGSLRLDDFIVKLQCSTSGAPTTIDDIATGEEDNCEILPRIVSSGDSCCNCNQSQGNCCNKHLGTISTVDQFNAAITSSDDENIRWIILDMNVKYADPTRALQRIINNPWNDNTTNIETLMQSFGKLLYAIFSPNNNDDTAAVMSPSSEAQASQDSADVIEKTVTVVRNGSSNKMRQSSSVKLLFELFLQLGHPISICRLLSDLIDNSSNNSNSQGGDNNNRSSSRSSNRMLSFHDITCELEQMISQPHLFLNNPEREFYNDNASTGGGGIHFGQKYYGRKKELAKILDITTVYKEESLGLETIFVSGIAGSGKSHLVSSVGSFVSNYGFMVLTAKFQRGMEYTSREIVSTLMDEMVSNIVAMKESENDSDIQYVNRVSQSLSNALDDDSLSALLGFVPSIQSLIPGVVKEDNPSCTTHWQLVFLLSKLLHSVLNNQEHIKIFLALDDLQWADPTTLVLINELILSISKCPEERRRLVFVGMLRDGDFVTQDLGAFIASLDNLQCDGSVNVTKVKLFTLSVEDVTEMIMCELRLPRRLVRELADVVHKRTHGHAIFVVQLLNSLVSDSIISYSPMLRRYYWDQDKVAVLKTADNVASFIVSNLTSLSCGELQCLRIISCFGIQVQSDLLELLDEVHGLAPQGGFRLYLGNLVNQGIIEMVVSSSSSSSSSSNNSTATSSTTVSKVSTLVVFTHDLIQEQVYEGIPINERQQLHYDIGIFLSSLTTLDKYANSIEVNPIDATIHLLDLDDYASDTDYENNGKHPIIDYASSLISNATSQINSAGPQFFRSSDARQRTRFASWNLRAGKDAANSRSSFREALHYYKHGIDFLGSSADTDLWGNRLGKKDHHADTVGTADTALCLKLHEGAAFVSSALGESALVSMYTHEIIDNVKLEDSLVAEYLLIGSLSVSGRFKEAVSRGLAVLRALKFEIPETPTPTVVMEMMTRTEREASMYNFSQISNHYRRRVDSKTRNVLKLVDAMSGACYFIASPFLPLVACLTIRYSLQNGVCEETASALAIFAYFQVFLKKSFESGRIWGIVAKNMLDKASSEGPVTTATTRARFVLFAFLNFWYVPLQESSNHIQDIEDMSFKFGDPEEAYMAQCMRVRFLFFRGERLSILSHTVDTNLQPMARFSIRSATFSVLNKEMIDSLTGDKSSNPYAIFNGKICNKQTLLADAQSKMNFQIVEAVHLQKLFVSFWMGEYGEAVEASDSAMSFPCSKMPKVELPHHMFYRGIAAFQLYREGKGENWLKIGDEMQEQVEIWANNSKPIFENKLILLKAEQFASTCDVAAAKESYELSIKVARDNGYIHEQGLAYECMGNYLASIVEVREAERCLSSAHKCYMQWGAMAKADKLWKDWNLSSSIETIETRTIKHDRDE